jgi:hypothetical protein
VRRKAFGRDFGLSIRMALALLPILALYALAAFIAVVVLILAIQDGDAGAIFGWLFFAVCFGVLFYVYVLRGGALALRIGGARKVMKPEEEEVEQLVRRTAAAADLPPPNCS